MQDYSRRQVAASFLALLGCLSPSMANPLPANLRGLQGVPRSIRQRRRKGRKLASIAQTRRSCSLGWRSVGGRESATERRRLRRAPKDRPCVALSSSRQAPIPNGPAA